jgi:protein TonB
MKTVKLKHTRMAWATVGLLAGCSTSSTPYYPPPSAAPPAPRPAPAPVASRQEGNLANNANAPLYYTDSMSLERYKRLLAQRIVDSNPDKVYPGNPQALLRSVIVVKYVLDANGAVVAIDTVRSNGDRATLATAQEAIRHAAPYPAPPRRLLERGRVEIIETMLFNNDGRFQPRTIAQPQLDE